MGQRKDDLNCEILETLVTFDPSKQPAYTVCRIYYTTGVSHEKAEIACLAEVSAVGAFLVFM